MGEPLVMLRGEDDQLRVFSRVCRHRGMDLISGEGNTRRITCPYHAWTYDLAGRLTAAPLMERTIGFDSAMLGLRQFRTEVWQGFVFVTLSGDAPALSATAGALSRRLANYRLDEMRLLRKLDFDCPWNWKVMVENYLECCHHLAAHRGTLQRIIPAHKTWCEETEGPYALCHMPYRSDVDVVAYKAGAKETAGESQALPAMSGLNEAERRRGTLVHLFPTHVMVVYPERMDYLLIDPVGPERTRVTACFCLPEAIASTGDHEAAIDVHRSAFPGIYEGRLRRLRGRPTRYAGSFGRVGTALLSRSVGAAVSPLPEGSPRRSGVSAVIAGERMKLRLEYFDQNDLFARVLPQLGVIE